jgi:hypothetical protein
MRKLGILILLSLTILLVGCNGNTEVKKLDKPDNLVFDGVLSWDHVDNAVSYEISINGDIEEVTDNFFVFDSEGTYDVFVIAKAPGYLSSDSSDVLNLVINYENEIEFIFNIDQGIVSWNEVDDALSYNVFIFGTKYETEDAFFDISDFDSGVIKITVQAVYPIGVSNISDVLTVDYDLVLVDEIVFQYSIYSTVDLVVWKDFTGPLYVMNSDGEYLDLESVLDVETEGLKILSSFVKLQEVTGEDEEPFTFYLINGSEKTPIRITITDNYLPYIISQSVVKTDGTEDINFQFELFGGSLYSVNGTKTDDVLYEMNANILTIEAEFIEDKFDSSDSFVLSYVINVEEDSVIGYLNFNLLEE